MVGGQTKTAKSESEEEVPRSTSSSSSAQSESQDTTSDTEGDTQTSFLDDWVELFVVDNGCFEVHVCT